MRKAVYITGEMDMEVVAASTWGGGRDRPGLQGKDGLLLGAMWRAEEAEAIPVIDTLTHPIDVRALLAQIHTEKKGGG